ncbi:MAG: hypothetical protein RLZZ200_458 [Pseudomonadota bacterium]|jgi:thiol-disulfide isomerase/thioredoxin
MKASKSALLVMAVVAVAATAGYYAQRHAAPPEPAPVATPTVRQDAAAEPARKVPETLPTFTLKDRDGKPRTLADWKGRPLIVNFWATWCAPCRREIPLLNATRSARKAQNLEVVGIAVDFREDVLAYVKERPIDYPLLIGEEDGLEALKSVGMTAAFPFTLFADSQHRILALRVGELHADELDLILDEIRAVDSGQRDQPTARARISEGLKELATKRALASDGDGGKAG